jgi:FkbM family methyltransferase
VASVADIGAGTGLATALLHARGAHVIAVEPGPAMASQLLRRLGLLHTVAVPQVVTGREWRSFRRGR